MAQDRVRAAGHHLLVCVGPHITGKRLAEHSKAVAAKSTSHNHHRDAEKENRHAIRVNLPLRNPRNEERPEIRGVESDEDHLERFAVLVAGPFGSADDFELRKECPDLDRPEQQRIRPDKRKRTHQTSVRGASIIALNYSKDCGNLRGETESARTLTARGEPQ